MKAEESQEGPGSGSGGPRPGCHPQPWNCLGSEGEAMEGGPLLIPLLGLWADGWPHAKEGKTNGEQEKL
jgi:hypothetical protein